MEKKTNKEKVMRTNNGILQIMYYGKRFNKEYAEKVLGFVEKIRGRLKNA